MFLMHSYKKRSIEVISVFVGQEIGLPLPFQPFENQEFSVLCMFVYNAVHFLHQNYTGTRDNKQLKHFKINILHNCSLCEKEGANFMVT